MSRAARRPWRTPIRREGELRIDSVPFTGVERPSPRGARATTDKTNAGGHPTEEAAAVAHLLDLLDSSADEPANQNASLRPSEPRLAPRRHHSRVANEIPKPLLRGTTNAGVRRARREPRWRARAADARETRSRGARRDCRERVLSHRGAATEIDARGRAQKPRAHRRSQDRTVPVARRATPLTQARWQSRSDGWECSGAEVGLRPSATSVPAGACSNANGRAHRPQHHSPHAAKRSSSATT
jgi:site-specific DNA-cytosine methylase